MCPSCASATPGVDGTIIRRHDNGHASVKSPFLPSLAALRRRLSVVITYHDIDTVPLCGFALLSLALRPQPRQLRVRTEPGLAG
jgi:hypothetical protein